MNLLHQAMLACMAVVSLDCTASALQTNSGGKPRVLFPQTMQGQPTTGQTITFLSSQDTMEKAPMAADGSCLVWEYNSKLKLEVMTPGHELQRIEIDTSGLDTRPLHLMIDQQTGALKLMQKVTRRTPGYVAPPSDKERQLNLLIPGPPNDDCANAEAIAGIGLFSYSTVFATTDGFDEPSCNFDFSDEIKHDVWFSWTAPCTGMVNITDCGLALGDSRIAVYDGSDCPDADDDPIACGDDECGFLNSKSSVNFNAIAGNEYLIRVGNFPHFLLLLPAIGHIQIECMPVMNNDDCANAIAVDTPSKTMGSTTGATLDLDTESCGTALTAPGVWYEVVGTGTQMTAETCGNNTDYDTKLNVYCNGCGDGQLCIAGNDDACGFSSRVTWCSEVGAVYKILVQGFGNQTGDFQLSVSQTNNATCEPAIRCRFKGASCDGESCSVMFKDEAEAIGATFFGDGTDCCGTGVYDTEFCDNLLEDISATGIQLFLGDDEGALLEMQFGFEYFGEMFYGIGISSNGYCSFSSADLDDFTPNPIPAQDSPNGIVAPYWSDFDPAAGGSVTAETRGIPGARRLIVQWTDVPHLGNTDSNTFQVIFFETSNEIHFRYGELGVFPAGFAPPFSTGIENRHGTHGYGRPAGCSPLPDDALAVPGPCIPQPCVTYTPRWAPLCDNASALVIDQETNFSDLDGSAYDLDGVTNGVLQTNGLIINSLLLVDVPCAIFDVQGDLIINGAIFGPDTPQTPETGPKMIFEVCESMWINDNGLIDAPGATCGGTISICVGGDFHTSGNSGIRAVAQATYGSKGGWINIIASGEIDLGFQGFLVVKGEKAGHIRLSACSGDPQAIKIEGDLNAAGWGPYGCGGLIIVEARQGGIYLPGDNNAIATGDLADGEILLRTALIVTPLIGPFVIPAPLIQEHFPSSDPCVCVEFAPDETD